MFTRRIAKTVTAVATLIGLIGLIGNIVPTFVGDRNPRSSGWLIMLFFVMVLVGSYWFVVYRPGAP